MDKPFDKSITPAHVAALVKAEGKLHDAPHNTTLHDLGFTNEQLRNLQTRIAKAV